jgi:hypothetical protein
MDNCHQAAFVLFRTITWPILAIQIILLISLPVQACKLMKGGEA